MDTDGVDDRIRDGMEQPRHRNREVCFFQEVCYYPAAYVSEANGHREDTRQVQALLHMLTYAGESFDNRKLT